MRMMTMSVVAALLLVMNAAQAGEELRVGRYTQVSADPSEFNPLSVVAQVRFPREAIKTVGDALSYTLQRAGYTVTPADTDAQRLFALVLPESQREIGPQRVRYLTQLLVGDAFGLCINTRSREISVAAIESSTSCLTKQLRGE